MWLTKCLKYFLWLLLLWPQLGMTAIEVTHASRLDIFAQLQWCRSAPEQTIEQVANGGCDFKATSKKELAPGFSADAFWLRLVKYWLLSGHQWQKWLKTCRQRSAYRQRKYWYRCK